MDDEAEEDEASSELVLGLIQKLDADDTRMAVPAVFVPPGLRVAMADNVYAREHYRDLTRENFTLPSADAIKERIHAELDPIGMAIAIAQGMAIPIYAPTKDGKISVSHISVSTRERMAILKKLMELSSREEKKPVAQIGAGGSVAHDFLAMVQRAGQVAQDALREAKTITTVSQTSLEEEAAIDGA